MRDIKWSRDDAGNRLWSGERATYRVVSLTGPWEVEIHPADGVEPQGERDDSGDAVLLTLQESKVFIDAFEDLGDASAAHEMTMLWRRTKGA